MSCFCFLAAALPFSAGIVLARVLVFAACLSPMVMTAQEKPLERTFVPGATHHYNVYLTVRSELEGPRTEKIGAKTYVTPSASLAEATLSWRSVRRILAVNPDGSAEVEESLDGFSEVLGKTAGPDVEQAFASLKAALTNWAQPRALRYRDTASGQLRGAGPEGAPLLDEAAPQILSPWLLRALRPTAALPAKPLKFHQRWQEPREVQLPNWSGVQGTESGEWLETPVAGEPSARLHIVQQISGNIVRGPDLPREGSAEGRFHGESLGVVSLADGRLISATRFATREITWTLAPVEGLPEAPRFRGRLSVEIRIEEIE